MNDDTDNGHCPKCDAVKSLDAIIEYPKLRLAFACGITLARDIAMIKATYFLLLILCISSATTAAPLSLYTELDHSFKKSETQKVCAIPKGNGNVKEIPEVARLRVYSRAILSGEWEALLNSGRETEFALTLGKNKIPKILAALNEEGLLSETLKLAKAFNIHPMHILGPIIGENSFNGAIDNTIQNSFAKMFTESDFKVMSSRIKIITEDPSTNGCLDLKISNYWKWRCLLNKTSYLANGSNRDFISWFYQISNKGQGTFGLGQAQPFLLWSVSDLVAEKTKSLGYNYQTYELTDMKKPFQIIFNNKEMLAYIAAMAHVSITVYKQVAGVDISQNPGLSTTLYNVGDEYQRAYLNTVRGSDPQVNFMGWYVNRFEDAINNYLKTTPLNGH